MTKKEMRAAMGRMLAEVDTITATIEAIKEALGIPENPKPKRPKLKVIRGGA